MNSNATWQYLLIASQLELLRHTEVLSFSQLQMQTKEFDFMRELSNDFNQNFSNFNQQTHLTSTAELPTALV
uniref:Uncharacterized protein n=1 Tax=Onchocerca volvulus TaxID=6282 RepID=A0A8R1XVH3_ONCVO